MNDFISAYVPTRTAASNAKSFAKQPRTLLQEVVEGLPGGFLILTREGGVIGSNSRARSICRRLSDPSAPVNDAPHPIWQLCTPLFEQSQMLSGHTMSVEGTVGLTKSTIIRVRARWLQPARSERILVLLDAA